MGDSRTVFFATRVFALFLAVPQMFGFERLEAAIVQYAHQTASGIKKAILTEFRNHCQQHEQEDDVTLIVIKMKRDVR